MGELHEDAVVLDCHHDLILSVARQAILGERGTFRHRWIPELRAGGVNVQVIPISTESTTPEISLRQALQHLSAFYREVELNAGEVAACTNGAEIDGALRDGKIAMVLALEGASLLGNEPSLVPIVHRLGVRMISFTHMGRSWLGDGSGENHTGGRLTRAGVQVLAEMERLGILMDVSHLGIASTEHVLELATRPVIASHSSARALWDHHRNLTDDQLRGVARTGGVIGATAIPGFVNADEPTADRMVDHIEHMVEIVGPEHVGLGPDFIVEIYDDMLPAHAVMHVEGLDARARIPDLFSSRHLPLVTEILQRRGFADQQIRGILGLNFLRVFQQVMGVAGDGAPLVPEASARF
jgi:membrane dipeptidase